MLIMGHMVNDDNGGDLTSGAITIGAKDSGFNGATTFIPPGDGTPVGTFASGSFSITTQQHDSKDRMLTLYIC